MVEQLGDVVVRERVRVVPAGRVRIGLFDVQASESAGRLVGERIRAQAVDALVATWPRPGAPERHPAVGTRRLVRAGPGRTHDHVDDR